MTVSFRWAACAVAVVGCLLLWLGLVPRSPTSVAPPLAETLPGSYELLPQQPPVTRSFPFEVEGERVVERFASLRAPVDGVLQRLYEHDHGLVEQGTVLAVIDSAELQQKRWENDSKVQELNATLQLYSPTSNPELRKLRANLEAGKKKYQYAEKSFEQLEALYGRGLIAGREYADAREQLEGGKLALLASEREYVEAGSLSAANHLKISNQLQIARLEQEQLRKASESLMVKAPFSGQLRRYAPGKGHDGSEWLPGDSIKAQEPLFYLESSQPMVKVDAAKETLRHFDVGDTVTVSSIDGTEQEQGTVLRIVSLPYEDGASLSDTIQAQIWIGLSGDKFAQVKSRRVRVSKAVLQKGTAVPMEMVLSSGVEKFVYVKRCQALGSPFTLRRVSVSAEERGMALITAGLSEGECLARIKGRQT